MATKSKPVVFEIHHSHDKQHFTNAQIGSENILTGETLKAKASATKTIKSAVRRIREMPVTIKEFDQYGEETKRYTI